MDFDWNEDNVEHLAERGIEPEEAEDVFFSQPLSLGSGLRNQERRYVIVGKTNSGRFLVVVYTLRHKKVRVITAWDAPDHRKRLYRERRKG